MNLLVKKNLIMNQISYSFFTPIKYNDNKFYDKYISRDRYWYNLPALISLNRLFYPNFEIKFYISPDIINNPLYHLISESIKNQDVTIEVMNQHYKYTEPTVWRFKPIIESSVDILLCRDIDSIPNEVEVKATKYFLDNDVYKITSIRSHKYHNSHDTIMLAGLCGFRTKDTLFPNNNFDEFWQIVAKDYWGIDQSFLINFLFSKGEQWIFNHFLDSRTSNGDNSVLLPNFNCTSYDEKFYLENVNLNIDNDLLSLLNRITTWSGEPVNCRGNLLLELFKFDNYDSIKRVKDIVLSNDNLKKFYIECL